MRRTAWGACLLLGTPDVTESFPFLVAEAVTHILVGHAHFLAIGDEGIAALAASLAEGPAVRREGAGPDCSTRSRAHGIWSGQKLRHG